MALIIIVRSGKIKALFISVKEQSAWCLQLYFSHYRNRYGYNVYREEKNKRKEGRKRDGGGERRGEEKWGDEESTEQHKEKTNETKT